MRNSRSREARLVALSAKIYERLLALYPTKHRQEYGPLMTQLFCDQSHDAWTGAGAWGLVLLWLRVLLDLARTSMLEHFENLKQRTSMFNKALLAFRDNPTLRNTLVTLFGTVVVLVVGLSVLLVFLAPEQYQSLARIKVEQTGSDNTPEAYRRYKVGTYDPYFIRKQFGLIQSESILSRVAKALNLAESWGKASAGGAPLNESDTVKLLKQRLHLRRPVRNTSLIEVRVCSQNPTEASAIANMLAETYREFRGEERRGAVGMETPKSRAVEIVDTAVPALRPARPNKPFTLFLGLFGGILLALVVCAAGVLLVLLKRRLSGPPVATT
jgi:capsular polysaccharide biosynthesis protein